MQHLSIDYVEFYSPAFEESLGFFARAFGWKSTSFGPDYHAIEQSGVDAGIERSARTAPLIVLKAANLAEAYAQLKAAGATITREIFDYPGGQRFEFREPGGTLMAVWAEPPEQSGS